MSCFYSNRGSGEQKPQKGEPTEVVTRKLIMRKLIIIALVYAWLLNIALLPEITLFF